MAFFGSDWKESEEEKDRWHEGMRHFKDENDDLYDIPTPSVYQLLDSMTNEERLKVFNRYCKTCGSKDKINCSCQ